jgi:integrase
MARKVRHTTLESATARLKLPIRKKPHTGPSLARGIKLLYRRNRTNGSWVVKATDGKGAYWTKAFAEADDHEPSDGKVVLDFHEAGEQAKKLARGTDQTGAAGDAPITVNGALDDYKTDLESRGANAYNAEHPRIHLSKALLAKPVQLLDSKELQRWRNSLLAVVKPATANRISKSLCAGLALAAQHDRRIKNQDAWKVGLAGLPDAQEARNVVIADAKVSAFVRLAYDRDAKLGLLVDLLAITGARPSQAVRLRVDDFRDHPTAPKLLMPKSGKGGGRNRMEKKVERYSVPITLQLATMLREAVKGRADDEPLLLRCNGVPWNTDPNKDYSDDVREIVKAIDLDPGTITMYCLRHSAIVRMLLQRVPIRLVASLHNTSVDQIERNYSRFITEHADDHARVGLLHHEDSRADNAGNVVLLAR